ncbi:MAG: zinc resistance-associated protein [Desulfovibrionales bacterium]|jgi:zinc resistance-associated protein|nr:zinc resistance-associated protein [Desulfovibrionales bacterium]
MQRRAIIPIVAIMALLVTTSMVFADSDDDGPYFGGGPGWQYNVSPEKAKEVQAVFDKHRDVTMELRDQLWAKKTELNALIESGKATRKDIQELVGDITELRAKMRADHQEMAAELSKVTGQPVSSFMGPGYGPCRVGMRGPGMGFNAGWGCNGPGGRGGDRSGWGHSHMRGFGYGYGPNTGYGW